MAKKKEPEKQGNEELFLALNLLEKEKGIPVEFMLDKIKKAISTACKNNYGNEDVDIDVNPEKGVFNVYLRKEIVEEVEAIGAYIKTAEADLTKRCERTSPVNREFAPNYGPGGSPTAPGVS